MMRFISVVVFAAGVIAISSAANLFVDPENGNDASGDGSAGAPYASMDKVFGVVQGGDTVLLQPGYYGSVEFDGNHGVGSDSTGWITYLADPAVCTPRPDGWYEDSLARPDTADPGGRVIFSGIKIDYYSSDLNRTDKTGTPDGHYIVLEGVNVVGGNVNIVSYVSHVVIRNCNVFGHWADYSSRISGTGINLYRAYDLGSNYRDILVEGCYATRCGAGAMLLGNFYNVTVKDCHFHHFSGSGIRINGVMDSVLIEGNHVHHQVTRADVIHSRHQVTEPDATEPDRIFTIDAATSLSYYDFVTVVDATTDSVEVRAVESYDNDTKVVVLETALSFDVEAGDSVQLWDGTHGSGLAVRADNFTLRGNRVHSCGASRGLYFYDRAYHSVIIENNLFYSIYNYTVDLHSYMGDHCRVVNNTFVSTRHSNYYSNNDGAAAYGHAMIGASPADGTDAGTIVIANNVFVGYASVGSDNGAVVKNNIVFSGTSFEEDDEGNNSGNLVYYDWEDAGSEPSPFHQAGGFFVGGDGFDDGYLAWHQNNFNEYFRLAEGSDAVGFADPAYATATDMAGTARDGAPDAGCYELAVVSVGEHRTPAAGNASLHIGNPLRTGACGILFTDGLKVYSAAGTVIAGAKDMTAGIYVVRKGAAVQRISVVD